MYSILFKGPDGTAIYIPCNHGIFVRVPDLGTKGWLFEPDTQGKPQLVAKTGQCQPLAYCALMILDYIFF